jgi:hypothetical protein
MCWRDDIQETRFCSLCRSEYYGDLGHRNCPKLSKTSTKQTDVPPPETQTTKQPVPVEFPF